MKPDQHQGVPDGAPSSLPTYAELCAGYGGLGLAVEEVFGAKLVWYSEFDAAPSKIMAHHWPDAPNHGDMTRINWAKVMRVLILSGGTPCQDLSGAGRRRGMTEGTRSNLWVHMREAIAIQKPKWVVWENVRGAFSACADSEMGQCQGCVDKSKQHRPFLRALGRVLGDLSDLGYDTQWRGLRASDVGACHARFRVFVLAKRRATFADRDGSGRGEQRGAITVRTQHPATEHASADVTNAERGDGGEGRQSAPSETRAAPDASSDRWPGDWERTVSGGLEGGQAPDAHHGHSAAAGAVNWGEYEPAIRRWERTIGRSAPRPTEPTGRNSGERLSPRFTEFMMGLPDGWVTDPAIGISRNEQLKACGNGVVPQQAIAALRDMLSAFEALAA